MSQQTRHAWYSPPAPPAPLSNIDVITGMVITRPHGEWEARLAERQDEAYSVRPYPKINYAERRSAADLHQIVLVQPKQDNVRAWVRWLEAYKINLLLRECRQRPGGIIDGRSAVDAILNCAAAHAFYNKWATSEDDPMVQFYNSRATAQAWLSLTPLE